MIFLVSGKVLSIIGTKSLLFFCWVKELENLNKGFSNELLQ